MVTEDATILQQNELMWGKKQCHTIFIWLQDWTFPLPRWMDELFVILHPFQQYFSNIRMMGG